MNNNLFFSFKDIQKDGSYNLYLFKDFSGKVKSHNDDIFNELDKIRQWIHSPDTIFILCSRDCKLDKQRNKKRFTTKTKIEYLKYHEITQCIFKIGIQQIVKDNKVVQHAPHGMYFKKTSGGESEYFIKASLSLLEYSQICFLALVLHQKITPKKIPTIEKFYVDTSSIISLIQALIHYQNIYVNKNNKYTPEIINFKSYNKNNIDFNANNPYTIMSASSSGNLQKDIEVDGDKCITIFLPESVKEKCLFKISINIQNKNTKKYPIPLTSEDFSLEYSKSEEVIITKTDIEKLDTKKQIQKLLNNDFKEVEYNLRRDEVVNDDILNFDNDFLNKILKEFTRNMLERSLLSEKDNLIIYRGDLLSFGENIIKIDDFLKTDYDIKGTKEKNIIVFLNQSNKDELTQISQKIRECQIFNITYIIGILLTENFSQSKNLENNICFNDTSYKYGFYCYLDLPLLSISEPNLLKGELSDGFVFYDGKDSSKLNKNQVYLVVCLILELLRSNDKLNDNISYHDVISPKNFSRFNDTLLQLSILNASQGRELNFRSNANLSHEMLNIIMDLMRKDENIGKIFIEFVKNKKINLTEEDYKKIVVEYPKLFKNEERV